MPVCCIFYGIKPKKIKANQTLCCKVSDRKKYLIRTLFLKAFSCFKTRKQVFLY